MIDTPKIIFIDWYRTLSNSIFWEHMTDPSHKYSSFHSEITSWLFSKNKHLIDLWMRGEFSSETICEMISGAPPAGSGGSSTVSGKAEPFRSVPNFDKGFVRGTLSKQEIRAFVKEGKHIDLDADIIHNELAESCRNMVFVSDEIPDLIQKIRSKGIKAVVATDNMDTFRKFTIAGMNLDELFDDYLISHEIGYLKSDIGENGELLFFEKFMKENEISYKDAVLLDDSVSNMQSINNVGLKTVQITDAKKLVEILKNYASQ